MILVTLSYISMSLVLSFTPCLNWHGWPETTWPLPSSTSAVKITLGTTYMIYV